MTDEKIREILERLWFNAELRYSEKVKKEFINQALSQLQGLKPKDIRVKVTVEEDGSIYATSVPHEVTLEIIDKRLSPKTHRNG